MPAYVSGTMLEFFRVTKILILQVAPGTGQNPAREDLVYTLIGQKNRDQLSVSFQPNFACEDFARNRRLTDNGDGYAGLFMEAIRHAHDHLCNARVIVEAIHQGNPALIFGELLTLAGGGQTKPRRSVEPRLSRPGRTTATRIHAVQSVRHRRHEYRRSLPRAGWMARCVATSRSPRWKLVSVTRDSIWVTIQCEVDSALTLARQDRMTALNDRIEIEHDLE